MKMDRRSLLGLLGAGAASPPAAQGANTGSVAFRHGVASGDPDTRSAVFWTRITPGEASSGEVAVVLEVARDADFRDIVRRAAGLKAGAMVKTATGVLGGFTTGFTPLRDVLLKFDDGR